MMSDAEECPTAESVARLIDGELSPEERASLEAHMAECAECYRVLTEATEVWWRVRDGPK